MPRKPKQQKTTAIIHAKGRPVRVTLYPPKPPHGSWYAYWPELAAARSTGQQDREDALAAVVCMLENNGKLSRAKDLTLTDEEFREIQRWHFGRKTDESAKRRASKSLANCLDALAAFSEITAVRPITRATPDDCATFQRLCQTLPNNWRRKSVEKRRPVKHYSEQARERRRRSGELDPLDELPRYSPNNILRWSRSLQAAFERANRNALKRKCVRGVVDAEKLLTSNPWNQFTWIEGTKRPIRQFDGSELLSLLDHLNTKWSGVPIAATAAKVLLWSGCRKLEITGLLWDSLRLVGNECHFEIVGKWGVERWFRLPEGVYQELLGYRTKSPFVFAAYNEQLRHFRAHEGNLIAGLAAEFSPKSFGQWFYNRVVEWSKASAKGHAYVHVFRKTTLQHARRGEDINRQVAADARVSESVMMTNYVKESDEEMRQRSNRTYRRIIASLPAEVAVRYGHVRDARSELEERVRAAMDAKDWSLASELAARLAQNGQQGSG